MSKSIEAAAIEAGAKTTYTKWSNLPDDLVPVKVMCQDYREMSGSDMSCHTTIQPKAEIVLRHIDENHSPNGGFYLELRHRPGQHVTFWKDLEMLGVELHDFRCDVCNAEMPLAPRTIIKHIGAHAGKSRAPRAGGGFWMTFKTTPPDVDGAEGYQD